MNPQDEFCPNMDCPDRGKIGEGNVICDSQKEKRCKCKTCGKTFSVTRGTALFNIKKDAGLFVMVVTLLAFGCPVQAIVHAMGLDERTVRSWWLKSGEQSERVHESVIGNSQLDFDGLVSYVKAFQKAFRSPYPTGKRGRPPLISWDGIHIVQVVKQRTPKPFHIIRRIVQGNEPMIDSPPATALKGWAGHQYRLHRTPQCDVSPAYQQSGTTLATGRSSASDASCQHVSGWHGL